MSYCKYCGKELAPGNTHTCDKQPKVKSKIIGACKSIEKIFINFFCKLGIGDTMLTPEQCFESNMKIAPDSIELDEGEIPVKQYDIAILRSRLKLEKAYGRLQVTNKRLLFRANGRSLFGKTTYQEEFALDKIDGVKLRKSYRFRFLDLFINLWLLYTLTAALPIVIGVASGASEFPALLCTLFAAVFNVPFFLLKKRFYIKMLCSSIGANMLLGQIIGSVTHSESGLLWLIIPVFGISIVVTFISFFINCLKPDLLIEIKNGSGESIQIKHKYMSLFWHKSEDFSGFDEILPSKDTDLAIKELGAVINDIKTLGDLGVEKWKVD